MYAKWKAHVYTIKYTGNGATGGSTADSIHTYDVAKALTTNGFTRAYTVTYNHNYSGSTNTSKTATYTFKNWLHPNGSTTYTDKQSVLNLSTTQGAVLTMTAEWNSASVSYTPTRTGYIFNGWDTTSSCSSASKTTNPFTPTKNITLYACWTKKTYNVRMNFNSGGFVTPTSISVKFGESGQVDVTPESGYFIERVSCTGGYIINVPTGTSVVTTVTAIINNESNDNDSVCTINFRELNYPAVPVVDTYDASRDEISCGSHCSEPGRLCKDDGWYCVGFHSSCKDGSGGDLNQGYDGYCPCGKWTPNTGTCYGDYYCKNGGTLSGKTCTKTTYTCPNGGTLVEEGDSRMCVF